MLEKYLVEHCSPTLASLKTANLLRCCCPDRMKMRECVTYWNQQFSQKGIRMMILKEWKEMTLIYLYRPERLKEDLSNSAARELLIQLGYQEFNPDSALLHLKHRMKEEKQFPHEIGIFLGYPLEDVTGFLENEGKNYSCRGLWKVYGDAGKAQCIFQKFRKCHDIYCKRWQEGYSIQKLTVAS